MQLIKLVARYWEHDGKSYTTTPGGLFNYREKFVDIVKTLPNKVDSVSSLHTYSEICS